MPKAKTCILHLLIVTALAFCSSGCDTKKTNEPADQPFIPSRGWLQGYSQAVTGGVLKYHSPHADVASALLVRSLNSENYISWETEAVPTQITSEFVTFIWLFGIDVEPIHRSFNLYVNDEHWFTITNPVDPQITGWTLSGPHGASLQFRVTMVDRYKDVMGYAALRLPTSKLARGKPVRLKVAGETAGSRMWYMTFQSPVREGAEALPQPALIEQDAGLFQPVRVHIVHMGEPTQVKFIVANVPQVQAQLKFGFNLVTLYFPKTEREKNEEIRIVKGNADPLLLRFRREPVREWSLYLVQHTHTDIGYTRPQTEILAEHLRFIDYALDYCDMTDDYPDEARFRWTCEASWAVNEYLKVRPQEQRERLRQRVNEGRIEITAMPFNLSEIADENILQASLKPLKDFHQAGLPVKTAMQNDVNGIGWCLADYFAGIGVSYLQMGQHGHRARIPFDKPTAFWWESPSGKRILAFRADHYMTGNFWGIHTGSFSNAEKELLTYLQDLESKNYPFQRIAVQYSGYYTDNAPPATAGCDFIRAWNRKYAWPKLRSATAQEFFNYLEKEHSEELSVHRVAWPDWWSDGFGSAARETAAARKTQMQLLANKGLFSMAALLGEKTPPASWKQIEKIEQALLFWDEHTMGAAESISDPLAENSIVQWAEKAAYIWEAVKDNRLLEESAMGLIQGHLPRDNKPTISVFNTMNWPRSGLVRIYIDHEVLPAGKPPQILDNNGKQLAAQAGESRADGTYWYVWVTDVPAFGYKTFGLDVGEAIQVSPQLRPDGLPMLENEFYRLVISPETGGITSLWDKELEKELCDPASEWHLGQVIHEVISNRAQLEQYRLVSQSRTGLKEVQIEGMKEGPIWDSLTLSGVSKTLVEGTRLQCEFRLYKESKRLELHYAMRKKAISDPEAVYVAFPFAMPDARLSYEAQGGIVYPGENQLEGTSADWHAVQNFAMLQAPQAYIVWGSPEIPLAHFGGLNLGNFRYIAKVEQPQVFSWVMNNYWVTNFRDSQEGDFYWSYSLSSGRSPAPSPPSRIAWEARVPLLARVFPAGQPSNLPRTLSLLKLNAENTLVISARPVRDRDALVLHLREIAGQPIQGYITYPQAGNVRVGFYEVNVLGEVVSKKTDRLELKPYESKFILVPFGK